VLRDRDKDVNQIHIYYFGDHDPSGIDMTRDITERLIMFSGLKSRIEDLGHEIEDFIQIHRLALNWDQVEQWNPPENPAKETDSRYQAYADEFGESSWELDAVEPRTLAALVRDAITELIDQDQWTRVRETEEYMRKELMRFANGYERKEKKGGKK
jgi:hypothetical protein